MILTDGSGTVCSLRPDSLRILAEGHRSVIVGMEGDGPIMGTPRFTGVLVLGRNLPAVDATCVRIMGYDPQRVSYLRAASRVLGPVHESKILQRGEAIRSVVTKFKLEENIPVHKKLIS